MKRHNVRTSLLSPGYFSVFEKVVLLVPGTRVDRYLLPGRSTVPGSISREQVPVPFFQQRARKYLITATLIKYMLILASRLAKFSKCQYVHQYAKFSKSKKFLNSYVASPSHWYLDHATRRRVKLTKCLSNSE